MRLMRSLCLLVLVATASPAFAETGQSCGLPYCDIPKALSQFQTLSSQEQFDAIKRATVSANKATATEVLKNINVFAAGAKALLIKAKADRVLIDAASQILNICVSRLARYSDLNADALLELFRQIPLELGRYDVLMAWTARIKEVEDRAALLELAKFFSGAGKICEALDDDIAVVAVAKGSEQTASKKLNKLQPIFEGVYNAEVACEGKTNCAESAIDRLVIMDALGSVDPTFGGYLTVNLVASKVQVSVYRFGNVVVLNGGRTLEGLSSNAVGAVAKLHLDFDATSHSMIGYVDTVDFKLVVSSVLDPNASLISLFDKQLANPIAAPIPASTFDKVFKGTFSGKEASLKVSIFAEDPITKREESVGGTLSIAEIARYKLRFHAGRFFPKTGLLMLVAASPSGGSLKAALTVRPRESGNGYELNGFSYSSENAQVNEITLSLAGDQEALP